jgi:hypothetical protein
MPACQRTRCRLATIRIALCITLVSSVTVQGLPSLSDISRKISQAESHEGDAPAGNKLGLSASIGIPDVTYSDTPQASKEAQQQPSSRDSAAQTANANGLGASGQSAQTESHGQQQAYQQAQGITVQILAAQHDDKHEDEVGLDQQHADEVSSPSDKSEESPEEDGMGALGRGSVNAKEEDTTHDSMRPLSKESEEDDDESDEIDHAHVTNHDDTRQMSSGHDDEEEDSVSISSDQETETESEHTINGGAQDAHASKHAYHNEHEIQDKPVSHLDNHPSESLEEPHDNDINHDQDDDDDDVDTQTATPTLRDHLKHEAHVCEPVEQRRKSMRIGLLAAAMMNKDRTSIHVGKGRAVPQSTWEPNLRTMDSSRVETEDDVLKKLYQDGQIDTRALDALEGRQTDTTCALGSLDDELKQASSQATKSTKLREYGVEMKIWTGWKDFWRVQFFR